MSEKFCDIPGCDRKLRRDNSVGCCRHHPEEYARRYAQKGASGRWTWGSGRSEEEQKAAAREQMRATRAAMSDEERAAVAAREAARNAAYRAALSEEEKRDQRYRTKFGVSFQQVSDLLAAQGFRCAMPGCAKPLESISRPDPSQAPDGVVDHCHETGKVRGILCHRCNVNLGHFEKALRNGAAEYLVRGPAIPSE